MSEGLEASFDSWGDGEMRTRHDFDGIKNPRVFEGEVDPGEYTKTVAVSHEITVLSGAIYYVEEASGPLQVCRQGQKFDLQSGRTYTFKMNEKVGFRCVYKQ